MLEEIILPTTITVHLGRPTASAQNVTIGFVDYIKNVASSEIYPTWPYEALRANIWCQMSLALNRIYTEWYRSRGYSFDITNSTAFDQAFVPGRNIYDNIAAVVDEVMGDYLKKPFYREPYYAEYCDGKRAQCPGLKQWGTLDLANRGYDSYGIIRYYYGDQMQFLETDNWQPYTPSYPGYALRLGSSGQPVFIIQELLNGIAVNYPNIPLIRFPEFMSQSASWRSWEVLADWKVILPVYGPERCCVRGMSASKCNSCSISFPLSQKAIHPFHL